MLEDDIKNIYSLETIVEQDMIEQISFFDFVKKVIEIKGYKNKDARWLLVSMLCAKLPYLERITDLLNCLDGFDEYLHKIQSAIIKDDLLNNDYSDNNLRMTMTDIDLMSGVEFEDFLYEYFIKQGYVCKRTKTTGDQGIDLLIEKDGIVIGVQAKCYSGTVGNHAIMETVAGMNYYNANRCMVITNSTFTKSAIELAKANKVVLWDRTVLQERLSEL